MKKKKEFQFKSAKIYMVVKSLLLGCKEYRKYYKK